MEFEKIILKSMNLVIADLCDFTKVEPFELRDIAVEELNPELCKVSLSFSGRMLEFLMLKRLSDGCYSYRNEEFFTPYVGFTLEKLDSFDLDSMKIVPGYCLAICFEFFKAWEELLKNGFSDEELRIFRLMCALNSLAFKKGVKMYSVKAPENETRVFKVPLFFYLDETNELNRLSQLRVLWFPQEYVSENFRLPHSSHYGRVDILETPETDEIGLRLFVVNGARYDPETLKILSSNEKTPLSLSTSLVPFIQHSDSARVLMGGKNMKQALQVDFGEEPLVKTGSEKYMHTFRYGVNAFVVYMLFGGLTFEDGIVVSESFARKMKVSTVEEHRDVVKLEFDKNICRVEAAGDNKFKIKLRDGKNYVLACECDEGRKLVHGDFILALKRGERVEKRYLRYPSYYPGIMEKVKIMSLRKLNNRALVIDVEYLVKVEKPLRVGDKLTGRHGNKGVVSAVLSDDEMPEVFVDGKWQRVEVIFSPLSVVSRMNLGQLLETHVGLLVKKKGYKNVWEPFEKVDLERVRDGLRDLGADNLGRFRIRFQGKEFRGTAGYQYILRLDHCVGDKLHVVRMARPFVLTNQPLKGRKRFGGQRFGEMEFWTLFDHNALRIAERFAGLNVRDSGEDRTLLVVRIILATLGFMITSNGVLKKVGCKKALVGIRKELEGILERKELEDFVDNLCDYLEQCTGNVIFGKNLWKFLTGAVNNPPEIDRNTRERLIKLISGKEGFIRDGLLAKRLHRSGRAVIVPAPDLDVDRVYLPLEFAVEWYGEWTNMKDFEKRRILEGDSAERQRWVCTFNELAKSKKPLVLLNRQPSLHRHSIQAFYPLFWTERAIGLPIMVCKGFNADFDGDTMAVYFLDEDLYDEAREMLPSKNPFVFGDGSLAYSVDQDIVYGMYLQGVGDKKDAVDHVKKVILDARNIAQKLQNLQNEAIKNAMDKNLSLSFFEAAENQRYMRDISSSKCRGGEAQYEQLYGKINGISNSNFGRGVPFSDYFEKVETSLACRGRKTLMDKKLHVAQAGYLTRKLVHLMQRYRVEDKKCDGECWIELDASEFQWVKDHIGGREYEICDGVIKLLSPVKCNDWIICRKAFGFDPGKRKPAVDGMFVGIASAHSLGERGTQLSMQTFHTGKAGFDMKKVAEHLFWPYKKDGKGQLCRISEKMWSEILENRKFDEYLRCIDSITLGDLMGTDDSRRIHECIKVSLVHFELLFKALCDAYGANGEPLKIPHDLRKVEPGLGRGALDVLIFEGCREILESDEFKKVPVSTPLGMLAFKGKVVM